MKIIYIIAVVALLDVGAHSGVIKQQIEADPTSIETVGGSGNYAEILAYLRAAHQESVAESDELTRYACLAVLAQAESSFRYLLAIDFALVVDDLDINAQGAKSVKTGLSKGQIVEGITRQNLIAKLKAKLPALEEGANSYKFAAAAAEALVFLEDTVGLDLLLTNGEMIANYQAEDKWRVDSSEAVFLALKEDYTDKVEMPGNTEMASDRMKAAFYELCRARRSENKLIVPLAPIVRLDFLRSK